ncbi:hypothetical protein EMIT0P253_120042 [Pseudomonas sp. IT-P253]
MCGPTARADDAATDPAVAAQTYAVYFTHAWQTGHSSQTRQTDAKHFRQLRATTGWQQPLGRQARRLCAG